MKLKYSEVKPLREKLLAAQTGCCALCQEPVVDDAVLDHDHKTGLIRGVLHRGCNAMLGKIENNMPRNRVNIERLSKLADNLIKYLVADAKSEFLHPTFKIKEPKMGRGRGRGKKPPKR
jgi:hypothetical protein